MDSEVGQQRKPSPLSAAEQDLLQSFQAGDGAAFHGLIGPHLPGLLALARRQARDAHWAEDLLQETLVRAYRGLPGFRGEAGLRTWLFRILVRLSTDPTRWRLKEQSSVPAADIPDALGHEPDQDAIARELRHRLDEAMERIPPRQRTALHLRAVEGMDYAAIAAVLECSPAAARMLVLEARRKVLARLEGHLEP